MLFVEQFSSPRIEARKLMIYLINKLHDDTTDWLVDVQFLLSNSDTEISVSSKDGRVYLNDSEIWMPFFKRWRLARAAKQRAINEVYRKRAKNLHIP